MILSAQDHRDLVWALGLAAAQLNRLRVADAHKASGRFVDLQHRFVEHPIATTAVIQAVPTAREVSSANGV